MKGQLEKKEVDLKDVNNVEDSSGVAVTHETIPRV